MKRNAALWSVCFLITALVLPPSAAADPISVTGGSLQMVGSQGRVDLAGERGFFLTSNVLAIDGFYAPHTACNLEICSPGSEVSLRAMWGGSSLSGQLGFEGRVYDDLGGLDSFTGALVDFTGSFVVPPLAPAATLTVPFRLRGSFGIPNAAGTGSVGHTLTGFGTATISLTAVNGMWAADAVRYDLSAQQPVPEPGTILLVGFGTVAIARRLTRKETRRPRTGWVA